MRVACFLNEISNHKLLTRNNYLFSTKNDCFNAPHYYVTCSCLSFVYVSFVGSDLCIGEIARS